MMDTALARDKGNNGFCHNTTIDKDRENWEMRT